MSVFELGSLSACLHSKPVAPGTTYIDMQSLNRHSLLPSVELF
jgi:hypothetical protein